MSVRLVIVDDQEVVRNGLHALLAGTEIQVVGESASGDDLPRLVGELKPDVILLDLRLGETDGLNVLSRLRNDHPQLPVLIFSAYDNPTHVARAAAFQAVGYLLKRISRQELIDAIRKAASGDTAWTREELRRVTGALATPRLNGDIDVPLTHRESEVLKYLANGLTNKEIANSLHISYETVKEHVQHILRKVGVADRTQAAVWAVRKGLV
jgi:DNA-binding NarL/FixJ family response regulator